VFETGGVGCVGAVVANASFELTPSVVVAPSVSGLELCPLPSAPLLSVVPSSYCISSYIVSVGSMTPWLAARLEVRRPERWKRRRELWREREMSLASMVAWGEVLAEGWWRVVLRSGERVSESGK
jgi:hypothetical protein